MHRQVNAVAGRRVADVEVAAPFALAVDARRHLTVRRDAERADEWRDRPGDPLVEAERPVAHRTARARRMPEDAGRVVAGELRPPRRLAQRSPAGPDRAPR